MPPAFEWITLLQIPLVIGVVWTISHPLSIYMARVALKQPTALDKICSPIATSFYRLLGINPETEHRWQTYAFSAISLNLVGCFLLIIFQMTQGFFSLMPNIEFVQALNTSMSFVTNTNWQSYIPETAISHIVQTFGLSVQMFLSAGTGMAVALAFIRAFMNHKASSSDSTSKKSNGTLNGAKPLGNFWVDCTRMILWILIPFSFILSIVFIGCGVIQSFYEAIASQEAIKLLGTNGGGFFNANSAHPLECPSALSHLIQVTAMLLIPFTFPRTFGHMIEDADQGKALLKAMVFLFSMALSLALFSQWHAIISTGPILEGMETRFGWVGTIFFNVVSTTTGTGATSAALSSLPPLTGLELLSNILTGGVIFGGVGSGLYHMILYAILCVFLAGLMIGRTPEYLGKKIESFDIKMTIFAIMTPALIVLVFTAFASLHAPQGASRPGSHGLTEILYGFASTTYNNGSSFASLKADMTFYQIATTIAMFIGRISVIISVLALAGHLIQKPKIPATLATFPTTGPIFISLLIIIIIMTSLLIFFPLFALGPLAEQVSQWHPPLF